MPLMRPSETSSAAMDEDIFDTAPAANARQPFAAAVEEGLAHAPYPSNGEARLLPPPNFKPFFTLIEDPETGSYHHPTVHYVFADDDQEIITAAAMDALDDASAARTHPDQATAERVLVLDVAMDGKTVTSASSLSPEWQNLKTSMTPAPSLGGEAEESERGFVLKISGQESRKEKKAPQKQGGHLDELMKDFGDRLGALDEALGKTRQQQRAEVIDRLVQPVDDSTK